MTPYSHQIALADEAYPILRDNLIVYVATEERTGKTLASILIAERCNGVKRVLVVTKKKALDGWHETIEQYMTPVNPLEFVVTNYHQLKNFVKEKYDLVIIDEAHNYIAAYPKPSQIFKWLKQITKDTPIIYISATPHAQSYSQLYHQLALSTWGPWRQYRTFYKWFKDYGVADFTFVAGRKIINYNTTLEDKVIQDVDKLFITKTRRELDFAQEPVDKVHYIDLKTATRELYNSFLKKRVAFFDGISVAIDSTAKLKNSLHMLEGGVAKVEDQYKVLENREKIDYILENFGDNEDVVIMYHFIAEGMKLREAFKHARILQASSFAEGVDLSMHKHLIIYSQDYSTAKHTQRRARQANKHRTEPIIVHYLLVANGISEQVYTTVSINKVNFVDSLFERHFL